MNKKLLTSIVTPISSDNKIDYIEFNRIIQHLLDTKSDGIIIATPTGEGSTLSIVEIQELINAAYLFKKDNPYFEIYLFAGSNNTQNDIDFLRHFNLDKIDGLMIVVPFFTKPTQQGIYSHYQTIATNFDTKIFIYSSPSRCGISIEMQTIIKLNKSFNNIVGIVNDSNDISLIYYLKEIIPLFICLVGDERNLLPSLRNGADGVVSIVSHLIGEDIKEMLDDFELDIESYTLNDFINLITDLNNLETTPIPIKYMLFLGGCSSMNLRLPLTKISGDSKRQIDMIID